MEIVRLGQADCHDVSLTGGKAASLSRLAANHRVPPGFCITTEAFDLWSNQGGPDDAANLAQSMPQSIFEQLTGAYGALADQTGVAEPIVAVRSSAVDEDGASASFAGQHDTYLNVIGVANVAKAVLDCWSSVRAERALEYRRQQGLSLDGMRLAVLVQELVPADVSAVLFSANPVTGNRDEVMINASWGLGESVVGGTVTPDTYVIRKDDQTVTSRTIAQKLRMTIQVPGGTAEVDVPPSLQTKPTLNEEQVVGMANLAVELERDVGVPVDVECSYYNGTLYLLQCRPITTL